MSVTSVVTVRGLGLRAGDLIFLEDVAGLIARATAKGVMIVWLDWLGDNVPDEWWDLSWNVPSDFTFLHVAP